MRRKAGEIYGAVVTQARCVDFYAVLGVPDTPTGRYEMVTLHLFLVLERLRAHAGTASPLSRLLVEAFVADMDDSLRELGTGDLAVPKKVRRAASGLYERSMAYREALQAGDVRALAKCFTEHAYAGVANPGADVLASYAVAASAALASADLVDAPFASSAFPAVPEYLGAAA
ncbi:MAG: ubiquinol-cytochrome C chaperone family protein [Hyphomicrobium sp.]|jgi:cytochrome b pre-mRNA-processing protein 3